jgi:hypothetical protein
MTKMQSIYSKLCEEVKANGGKNNLEDEDYYTFPQIPTKSNTKLKYRGAIFILETSHSLVYKMQFATQKNNKAEFSVAVSIFFLILYKILENTFYQDAIDYLVAFDINTMPEVIVLTSE